MAKKSPDAFRTISEVADALDTPAHVLRFWESKFSQIKPIKRAGGRRYYRPQDIDLLAGIKLLLHEQGMTIKGAQKLLRETGVKHVAGLSPLKRSQKVEAPVVAPTVADEAVTIVEPAASQPMLDFGAASEDGQTVTASRIMSLLRSANRADLRERAEQIKPLADRLQALHSQLTAS